MYYAKAFWGLEDNPNANTLNNTFNVNPFGVTSIVVVIIFIFAVVLMLTVSRGF